MKDVLIEELKINSQIIDEALSFCQRNGLLKVSAIVNYFLSNEYSDKIENLSFHVRENLKELCKQFLYQEIDANSIISMPIQQLYIVENMSQRAFNICIAANYTTLYSILKYRWENSNFLLNRNCGAKSNRELLLICNKYDKLILDNSITLADTNIDLSGDKIKCNIPNESASIDLAENIDLETLAKIENMSVRSYNVCLNANLTSLRLILQHYIDFDNKKFLSIRNCGARSNSELIKICQKHESTITAIRKVQKEQGDHFSSIEEFLQNLKLEGSDYHILKSILSGKDFFPLFSILNHLIDCHYIFGKERYTQTFKKSFNCYLPDTNLTLEEIGISLGLTRERIRQICEKLLRKIPYSFRFINKLVDKVAFPEYVIMTDQPIIIISGKDAVRINEMESTNFSPLFLTFILSNIYSEKYSWVGNKKTLFSNSVFKKSCLVSHSYLVKKTVSLHFNFERFLRYFQSLICQKRQEDEYIPFAELINKSKGGQPEDYSGTIESIHTILLTDFSNIIGFYSDGIILYQNMKRTLLSYVTQILQNSNKPLHYTEIYQRLIENGVNTSSEQSIHSLLNRENKIFGLKGSGIFDLRNKGGLFGTIGDVATILLLGRNEPIPLQELEVLICNELMVSKNSISVVLFNYENENRFERCENGSVKLKEWHKINS